jgi:hypothetical protein
MSSNIKHILISEILKCEKSASYNWENMVFINLKGFNPYILETGILNSPVTCGLVAKFQTRQ